MLTIKKKSPHKKDNQVQTSNYKPAKKSWVTSRPLQIAFVVIFAAIGAYMLIRSFALTTPPTYMTLPTVPDTSYAIPSGAVYVAASGNDSNAGTLAAPVATLGAAIAKTASGGTIVLRAGVYREGSTDTRLASITKKLTIQAYPHEQVWLDGTKVVTAWVADSGGGWRLDNSPSQGLCKSGCVESASLVDPNYPSAGSPQMVFYDGNALSEVTSRSLVTSGKFFFNTTTNALYIGDDPTGHTLEVTVQKRALQINNSTASGSAIKGIGIRRYGSIENPGNVGGYNPAMVVVSSSASNVLVENNLFYQSASRGFFGNAVSGLVTRGNSFVNNGMNGVDMFKTVGLLFEKNSISGNNAEHFLIAAGAAASIAGSKMVTISNSKVQDNIVEANNSNGLWCDLNCNNVKYYRNLIRNNQGSGIFYEISVGATIASNLIYGNSGSGIKASGPDHRIYNNTLAKNAQDLFVYEDSRTGSVNKDTRGVAVVNNIFSDSVNSSNILFNVVGYNNSDSVVPGQMVTVMDYNVYNRPTASLPTNILGWSGTTVNQRFSIFNNTLMSTTGRESNGYGVDGSSPFVDASNGNYTLASADRAIGSGKVLPSDIATDLGVATSPVNRGVIAWPLINLVTSPDTTPPAISLVSPQSGDSISGTVAVTATATDNVGVTRVSLSVDGSAVGQDTSSPYSLSFNSGQFSNGSHIIQVLASDAAGNTKSSSATVSINNADTTAPTAPNGLTGTAPAYNRVNLSWTASTDNIAVAGYYIVRGGVTIAQTSGTSYVDATVSPSTSYSYQVMAYDAANNFSGLSPVTGVTTPRAPDTTAPTAPTALTANAVSDSQINLSWTAGTDNIGVTGYEVYRDGSSTPLSTVTTTSFGDSGLAAASTHTYTIKAKDAAGNRSVASNAASATTADIVTAFGTITGHTNTTDGILGGVNISIYYDLSTHYYTSNKSGVYTIAGIPASSYTGVAFTRKGYDSQSIAVDVGIGQTVTKDVTLTKHRGR